MQKAYIQAVVEKAKGEVFTFVASDETKDRHGEIVKQDVWDLKNYKKNPVLLVDHDYRVANIVGKATNLRVSKGRGTQLTFDAVFHDITQLARDTKELVRNGILNTVSVGFIPKEDSNELLEISFVPVPANPSAARLSINTLAIEPDLEMAIKSFVDDPEPPPETLEIKDGEPAEDTSNFRDEYDAMEPEKTIEDEVLEELALLKEVLGTTTKNAVLVHINLLKQLVADSEKLLTLTHSEEKTVKGRNVTSDALMRKALRNVAKEVNFALQQQKKNSQ